MITKECRKMQVNSIQYNNVTSFANVKKTSFSGGISYDLAAKVLADGAKISDLYEKSAKIANVNKDGFVLSDGVYNAKAKVAEFLLSVVNDINFIPGLENIKPKSLKVKGSNLKDAFQNITKEELALANKSLADDVNTQYLKTQDYRNSVYAKRVQTKAELMKKYNQSEGFWFDYYKSLPNRNK